MSFPECDFGTPIELKDAKEGDHVRWWVTGLKSNMATDKTLCQSGWSDMIGIVSKNDNGFFQVTAQSGHVFLFQCSFVVAVQEC